MPSRTSITLGAMRFHTCVGILPHERELPQPLEIDLTVTLSMGHRWVDYRELYALVGDAVARDARERLEDIAGAIARELARRDDVAHWRIAIRKPQVALPGPLAFAEVVVEDHDE